MKFLLIFTIVAIVVIVLVTLVIVWGDNKFEISKNKCEFLCESKNMKYFSFDSMRDLCKCLDEESKIQEYGIK